MDFQSLTPVRGFAALPNQDTADIHRGEIRPSINPSDSACVCIQRYGTWAWEPLHLLSATKWMQLREKISGSITSTFNLVNSKKMKILKKDQKIKEEAIPLLHDLYGKLSRKEKIAFLNRHKKSFMAEFTCRACLTYCKKLKYCIHTNCTGLCDSCLAKNGATCLACGQKQEKECPICQEAKKASELMKSNTCRHDVCYKCYAMAFKSGHPIWDCPLCRQEFTKVTDAHRGCRQLQFESGDEFSDGEFDNDDDEWEDPADFALLEQAEQNGEIALAHPLSPATALSPSTALSPATALSPRTPSAAPSAPPAPWNDPAIVD